MSNQLTTRQQHQQQQQRLEQHRQQQRQQQAQVGQERQELEHGLLPHQIHQLHQQPPLQQQLQQWFLFTKLLQQHVQLLEQAAQQQEYDTAMGDAAEALEVIARPAQSLLPVGPMPVNDCVAVSSVWHVAWHFHPACLVS